MLVGSSQSRSSGPSTSALAMATRWRWPPERESLTLDDKISSRPIPSSSSSSRALCSPACRASRPLTRSHGSITASSTVRVGGSEPYGSCETTPHRRLSATSSWFEASERSAPKSDTLPETGVTCPEMQRMSVVFPLPDSPTIETLSPASRRRENSLSARTAFRFREGGKSIVSFRMSSSTLFTPLSPVQAARSPAPPSGGFSDGRRSRGALLPRRSFPPS